jgi:hypothetical protein
MPRLLAALCLIACVLAAAPAAARDRVALVIGNAGYANIPSLANPVNDARLMARTLDDAGFRVTTLVEADGVAMRAGVERFRDRLGEAGEGVVALFYFAGHGVRSDGFNYLLPVDVDIRAEADIAAEAVAAEWVLDRMRVPGGASIMVLDACRNNPFAADGAGTVADLGDGLARMTVRDDNLIAYATGPGDVALDGAGDHSPYTAALARAIRQPGVDVHTVFERVREEVETATDGFQVPWERSSIDAALVLRPGAGPARSAAGEAADDRADGLSVDLTVGFSMGHWALGCDTLVDYGTVGLPAPAAPRRRVTALSGGLALDLSVRQGPEGLEIGIVPASAGDTGRPIRVALAEIPADGAHTVHSRSRHPDLFGCGTITLHLTRGN